jgi:hypothetical protein
VPELRINHVSPFDGTALITLSFLSDEPCWFELHGPDDGGDHCRGTSETFFVRPRQPGSSKSGSVGNRSSRVSTLPSTDELRRRDPLISSSPRATKHLHARQQGGSASDSFTIGAKVALGIGIALCCIAIGAMGSFFYFRRRRRREDGEESGALNRDHGHGWRGRKGPDKKRAGGAASEAGNSDEPLCPVQPVFDGFPGSTGYDDVRSMHSGSHPHSTYSHSPTVAHTPSTYGNGGFGGPSSFWSEPREGRSIEREELESARLKTQMSATPIVVSYGPNPVTPTLNPRPAVVHPPPIVPPIAPVPTVSTPDPTPSMPLGTDYSLYDHHNRSTSSGIDQLPRSSPPRPTASIPIVSYGPNKVTPTPPIKTPTVPPDESILKRRLQEAAQAQSQPQAPITSHSVFGHERQFSWEADSPLLGIPVAPVVPVAPSPVNMGPLPPYATPDEFAAMEKGAVRKLEEPKAEAELPPTKDGFYHEYAPDVVEYELPGAAPNNEPQLPFKPYQGLMGGAVGESSSSDGRTGQVGPRGKSPLEVDEQKFLLDDEEMRKLREEKARLRALMQQQQAQQQANEERRKGRRGQVEEYDLGDPSTGFANSR